MLPPNATPILHGVVGSNAYNLATETSDVDTLGVFMYPTESFFSVRQTPEQRHSWGVTPTQETFVQKDPDPDCTFHEVGKMLRLVTESNPTVIEILFMPEYLVCTPQGQLLIDNRLAFLCTSEVKRRYVRYVENQMARLMGRGDFGSEMKKRREKHARHCYRLLVQASQLLSTGNLTLALTDAQRAEAFAVSKLNDEDLNVYIADAAKKVEAVESVLPEEVDVELVNALLLHLRLPERHNAP